MIVVRVYANRDGDEIIDWTMDCECMEATSYWPTQALAERAARAHGKQEHASQHVTVEVV